MRGAREARLQDERTRRLIGSQRVAYAAQGVDVNAGSPVDVQADTARMGAIDRERIEYNAWAEAFGLKYQAEQDRNSAAFTRMGARNAARNTMLASLVDAGQTGLRTAYMADRTKLPEEPKRGLSLADPGAFSAPIEKTYGPYDRPSSLFA